MSQAIFVGQKKNTPISEKNSNPKHFERDVPFFEHETHLSTKGPFFRAQKKTSSLKSFHLQLLVRDFHDVLGCQPRHIISPTSVPLPVIEGFL